MVAAMIGTYYAAVVIIAGILVLTGTAAGGLALVNLALFAGAVLATALVIRHLLRRRA